MQVVINETAKLTRFEQIKIGELFTNNDKTRLYTKVGARSAVAQDNLSMEELLPYERVHRITSLSVEVCHAPLT